MTDTIVKVARITLPECHNYPNCQTHASCWSGIFGGICRTSSKIFGDVHWFKKWPMATSENGKRESFFDGRAISGNSWPSYYLPFPEAFACLQKLKWPVSQSHSRNAIHFQLTSNSREMAIHFHTKNDNGWPFPKINDTPFPWELDLEMRHGNGNSAFKNGNKYLQMKPSLSFLDSKAKIGRLHWPEIDGHFCKRTTGMHYFL